MKKIVGVLIKKANSNELEQEVIVNEDISAPILKGDVLGTVHFYLDGQILDSVNLVAEKEISKKSFISMYGYITENWINLLRE